MPTKDKRYDAIQLCATQCAQGRVLEHWEVKTILHYYKKLAYKIQDLNFSKQELKTFTRLVASDKAVAQRLLKSKFNEMNTATFGTSEIPKVEGYVPNLENGKYIYIQGCLHCHDASTGITNFILSDKKLSHSFLNRKKIQSVCSSLYNLLQGIRNE